MKETFYTTKKKCCKECNSFCRRLRDHESPTTIEEIMEEFHNLIEKEFRYVGYGGADEKIYPTDIDEKITPFIRTALTSYGEKRYMEGKKESIDEVENELMVYARKNIANKHFNQEWFVSHLGEFFSKLYPPPRE